MCSDRTLAEAIAMDAISHGLEIVEKHKPQNFVPWLMSIAKNKLRHHVRSVATHEKAVRRLSLWNARSAFAESISREALDLFGEGLQKLTEMQRRALILRIVDHLSFDEIGMKMSMRAGACRALVHRARAALEEWARYMRVV